MTIVLMAAISSCGGDGGDHGGRGRCGDGTVTGAEVCDDGNQRDGDGCTALCQQEDGSSLVVNLAEGLLEFRFRTEGTNSFCPRIGSVAEMQILRLLDGAYRVQASVYALGEEPFEHCLPNGPVGDCVVVRSHTDRDLDSHEADALLNGFRRVRVALTDAPLCNQGRCLERIFYWSSEGSGAVLGSSGGDFAASDNFCAPRIADDESQRLATLINTVLGAPVNGVSGTP